MKCPKCGALGLESCTDASGRIRPIHTMRKRMLAVDIIEYDRFVKLKKWLLKHGHIFQIEEQKLRHPQ